LILGFPARLLLPSFESVPDFEVEDGMASYLVEAYDTKLNGEELARAAHRVELVAETLAREGAAVRFVHAIAIPGDDTCFLLCEAPTADVVGEVTRRAAISFDRVVEVQHVSREHVSRQSAASSRAAQSRSKEER
jgi:hypothetical protein